MIQLCSLGNLNYKNSSTPTLYDDFEYNFNFDIINPGEDEAQRIASTTQKVDNGVEYVFVVSGDLANPGRSIPRGTLLAVAVGFLVYLTELIVVAGAFPRESLIDAPYETLARNALFGAGLLVAAGQPLGASHRHFSHLMAIHPLGLFTWEGGEAQRRTMRAALDEMQAADYVMSLRNKLMGQVNLVLIGRDHVAPSGSFTLTSGLLDEDPIVGGTAASMVNGGINAFVLAASIEMPAGQRINAVSPGVIEEALDQYAPFFRGFEPVPARRAARAYAKSVEGARTGVVFRVR